jgi:hypothetical protein
MLAVYDPQGVQDQMGNPATRATHLKIIKSMRNPAKLEKLDPAAILNQNPIFEMGSKNAGLIAAGCRIINSDNPKRKQL